MKRPDLASTTRLSLVCEAGLQRGKGKSSHSSYGGHGNNPRAETAFGCHRVRNPYLLGKSSKNVKTQNENYVQSQYPDIIIVHILIYNLPEF